MTSRATRRAEEAARTLRGEGCATCEHIFYVGWDASKGSFATSGGYYVCQQGCLPKNFLHTGEVRHIKPSFWCRRFSAGFKRPK